MKKVLSFVFIAGMATAFVACGPSKEELEAKEKARQDSIRVADSIAAAEAAAQEAEKAKQDSIAGAERAAFVADSLHQDSVAKKLIKEPKK